jgi:ABC-type proline/glycine betaine transport system substrate-binding protein
VNEKEDQKKKNLIILLMTSLTLPVLADQQKPGENVSVQPACATWNTGYFQEALVYAGLKEIGYKVNKPKELQNSLFYLAVTLGDVDYWTNGWFPMHKEHMPKDVAEKGEMVGYAVKSGGYRAIWFPTGKSKNSTSSHSMTSNARKSRRRLTAIKMARLAWSPVRLDGDVRPPSRIISMCTA